MLQIKLKININIKLNIKLSITQLLSTLPPRYMELQMALPHHPSSSCLYPYVLPFNSIVASIHCYNVRKMFSTVSIGCC